MYRHTHIKTVTLYNNRSHYMNNTPRVRCVYCGWYTFPGKGVTIGFNTKTNKKEQALCKHLISDSLLVCDVKYITRPVQS